MEQCDFNTTSNEVKYSSISWTMILVFVPLITVFGVASNFAFIFVVYRIEAMRTITNIFLVNLAITDLLFLIANFVKIIGSYANSPVYDIGFSFDNVFGCVTPHFFIYLCYFASLWTVILVSIERYLAVCHPLRHMHMKSTRRAVYLVLASWLISVLFSSPTIPNVMVKIVCITSSDEFIARFPVCVWDCKYCNVVLIATDLIQFVTALIMNSVLYSLIVRKVGKSPFADAGSPSDNLQRAALKKIMHQRRNSVAKMLVVNGIVFFVCLTPFGIFNVNRIGNHFGWFTISKRLQLL